MRELARAGRYAPIAAALVLFAAPAHASPEPLGRTLEAPLDHCRPERGAGTIYYELGAPFDPDKPTVLVIADGQQFYVRPGSVAGLQERLFGDRFNVAGIAGRGSAEDFLDAVEAASGGVDWFVAHTLFEAGQWVEDIDLVRRDLVGKDGTILLYGRSGGAFLLHEYMAKHGRFVRRAFSQCAVMRPIEAELGVTHDHFWQEIGRQPGDLQGRLIAALRSSPDRRPEFIRILQRQNFFEPPDRLAAARAAAIDAIARGDEPSLARYREEYQVDAIEGLLASTRGAPIGVRIYEMVQPIVERLSRFPDEVYPSIESEALIAAPLLRAHEMGRIPAPGLDRASLRDLDTEVFILAGRHDHTVDYRSQIALAYAYRDATLFIADDDHMFARLQEAGLGASLARTFLEYGGRSKEMRRLLDRAAPLRWIEKD